MSGNLMGKLALKDGKLDRIRFPDVFMRLGIVMDLGGSLDHSQKSVDLCRNV